MGVHLENWKEIIHQTISEGLNRINQLPASERDPMERSVERHEGEVERKLGKKSLQRANRAVRRHPERWQK